VIRRRLRWALRFGLIIELAVRSSIIVVLHFFMSSLIAQHIIGFGILDNINHRLISLNSYSLISLRCNQS